MDPAIGRMVEVPPPDSPAGLAAARRSVTPDGDEFELPPEDRPPWAPLDVGRYGYPLPAAYRAREARAMVDEAKAQEKDEMPPPSLPLGAAFAAAVTVAWERHFDQPRKGTRIPYLSHLLAVASLAMEDASTDPDLADRLEEIAIAAVLHDAIEDAGMKECEIESRFGAEVARIVVACSDTDVTPKPPWKARKEAYLKHLAEADPATLCVSLADKRHNARCIVDDLHATDDPAIFWERFNADPPDQLRYYDKLATTFERRRPGRHADELRRTVEELKRFVDGA